MSHELHYTSVPRGLKLGSRGFCTVAATPGMPVTLFDRLESLSGYQAVYPPGDPSAALNPIVASHFRVTIGDKNFSVLSRIGPAGLDYSGRPNKYAHHVVIEPHERPTGGPAWLLSQPDFWQTAWVGEPRELPAGRTLPRGDRPAAIAHAWRDLTGDAGWAGVVAESFLSDSKRPIYLIFQPGLDLLPLFADSLALIPPANRWDVEFSTYLTQLPPGINCGWRGVLDGSAEANHARRLPNALILDLCRPLGTAIGRELVHLARTGERRSEPDGSGKRSTLPGVHATPTPTYTLPNAGTTPRKPEKSATPTYELHPELAARMNSKRRAVSGDFTATTGRGDRNWVLVAGGVLACLISVIGGVVYFGMKSVPKLEEVEADRAERLAADRKKLALAAVESATRSTPEESLKEMPKAQPIREPEPRKKGEPKKSEDLPKDNPPPPKVSAPQIPLVFCISLPDLPMATNFNPSSSKDKQTIKKEGAVAGRAIYKVEGLSAKELRLFNRNALLLKEEPRGSREFCFRTKTASAIGGDSIVAIGSVGNDQEFEFKWGGDFEQMNKGGELVNAVRDTVIGFQSGSNEHYLLLRDVIPKKHDAISLFDSKGANSKEKRIAKRPWAERPELVSGTNWRLGIRRWRIVNSLGSSRHKKTVIDSKQRVGRLESHVEEDINRGFNRLRLAIPDSDKSVVEIRLTPDLAQMSQFEQAKISLIRDKGLTFFQDMLEGHNPQWIADYFETLNKAIGQLRGQTDDVTVKVNGEEIKVSKRDISEIIDAIETEQTALYIRHPTESKLSVVVSLILDADKIIDIATLGDFPAEGL
jgi:hypothetical protein